MNAYRGRGLEAVERIEVVNGGAAELPSEATWILLRYAAGSQGSPAAFESPRSDMRRSHPDQKVGALVGYAPG